MMYSEYNIADFYVVETACITSCVLYTPVLGMHILNSLLHHITTCDNDFVIVYSLYSLIYLFQSKRAVYTRFHSLVNQYPQAWKQNQRHICLAWSAHVWVYHRLCHEASQPLLGAIVGSGIEVWWFGGARQEATCVIRVWQQYMLFLSGTRYLVHILRTVLSTSVRFWSKPGLQYPILHARSWYIDIAPSLVQATQIYVPDIT